jgi:hypothetical protein
LDGVTEIDADLLQRTVGEIAHRFALLFFGVATLSAIC